MQAPRCRGLALCVVAIMVLSAAVLLDFAAFKPNNSLFGPVVWCGSRQERTVALTFDDGPQNPDTDRILQILDAYQVHATFFVIGENAESNPDLLRRIATAGHAIGNHTYSHPNLVLMEPAKIQAEIAMTHELVQQLTGRDMHLFRPSYGWRSPLLFPVTLELKYTVVTWSVDPRDWESPGVDSIVERVMKAVNPGAIVLLHDGTPPGEGNKDRNQTILALPRIIESLRAEGYEFVTIPELLGDPSREIAPSGSFDGRVGGTRARSCLSQPSISDELRFTFQKLPGLGSLDPMGTNRMPSA